MDTESIERLLVKAGLKEWEAMRLVKMAKRKEISVSRMFFVYTWKYYAWSVALLLGLIFSLCSYDLESMIEGVFLWYFVALLSLFFTPFFKNCFISFKIQWALRGK
ncbi:MAG TPA: hypothetical protein VH187_12755 [Scandinavium sp.]|jgi:hypothetical protein|uniref:hypothetical protein n=1 Tax=Scandinavium sp. TaxID=2830653 RepID=UPI002E337E88|nr:hypothetical protein [Scandinavium sp.]HEX4502003.1 hypothetical protein [Scandinavium sp.]